MSISNAQKMKLEEQQILERAEELKIRKEKHLLDQAEMIVRAQEASQRMSIDEQKMRLEKGKLLVDIDNSEKEFSHKLASLLTDIHKTGGSRE